MKTISILVLTLTVITVTSAATLTCSSNSATSNGQYWCLPVDKNGCSECAAGVKYFCSPVMAASTWKKGIKVLGNCNSIAKYTAIATFNSSGKYQGHAAVFVGCNGSRIQAYDQWNGKTWSLREIWNTAGSVSNNPDQFYVVNY